MLAHLGAWPTVTGRDKPAGHTVPSSLKIATIRSSQMHVGMQTCILNDRKERRCANAAKAATVRMRAETHEETLMIPLRSPVRIIL